MFQRIRQRMRDMRTIKNLCESAERYANQDSQPEPGLEHFILAALALPDGSARRAFQRIGADPDAFQAAIAQQYAAALGHAGIAGKMPEQAITARPGPYRAKAQGGTLMRALASQPRATPLEALTGAHVILAGTAGQHGVAARALRIMGIDPAILAGAARAEIGAQPRG